MFPNAERSVKKSIPESSIVSPRVIADTSHSPAL
jgi:hypothetical protein